MEDTEGPCTTGPAVKGFAGVLTGRASRPLTDGVAGATDRFQFLTRFGATPRIASDRRHALSPAAPGE